MVIARRHWIRCGLLVASTFLSGVAIAQDVSSKRTTKSSIGGPDPVARVVYLPDVPYEYVKVPFPRHFGPVVVDYDNTPASNPQTNQGVALGRVLFYDVALSANRTTSCASCHQQSYAFADGKRKSVGFDGRPVSRNSMSLVNVRFYRNGKMFWDERARTLEQQVLMPIEDAVEMGHDLDELIKQLSDDPIYPPLFAKAFGDKEINRDRIGRALAQFVRAIVSYRSRYDRGRGEVQSVADPFPNFTDQENYGKQQFFGRGQCASCHMEQDDAADVPQTALFYLFRPVVNGIDSDVEGVDPGVAVHTKIDSDVGRFKVPSLRNIELTNPYMHDGRFRFLSQVIEQYNWSVRPHPNLDPRLQDFADNGMALPQVEKEALEAFLLTLTDHELIADPKFSDPFRRGR